LGGYSEVTVEDVADVLVVADVGVPELATVEVAGGDGEGAEEMAGAGFGELSCQLKADDEVEEGLDGAAVGEVDMLKRDRQGAAGLKGTAGTLADVAELLVLAGRVVVDAEAGGFAGGEAAGMTGLCFRCAGWWEAQGSAPVFPVSGGWRAGTCSNCARSE
jgi:hypothetical protein